MSTEQTFAVTVNGIEYDVYTSTRGNRDTFQVTTNNGNLRITDRLKDMFIVGGFNVYPAEVEQALLLHPAVAQVAVVGVADERLGEVGAAFVVLRSAVTAAELIAWARERIANYKVPREVRFVDALPLTASGKVNKIELRGSYSPLV